MIRKIELFDFIEILYVMMFNYTIFKLQCLFLIFLNYNE